MINNIQFNIEKINFLIFLNIKKLYIKIITRVYKYFIICLILNVLYRLITVEVINSICSSSNSVCIGKEITSFIN